VLGDTSAMVPGGVRLGTPAMTSRGLLAADFCAIADLLHACVGVAVAVQARTGKALRDFNAGLESAGTVAEIAALRARVVAITREFPMPGYSVADLK
jgi:glycine hydroxymethyltransferase